MFRPGNNDSCIDCFSRGVRCRGQKPGDAEILSGDSSLKPNLRERVARLEHMMETLLVERNLNKPGVGEKEMGAAEALSTLRADFAAPTPESTRSPEASGWYKENAPLMSLFDNAVIERSSEQVAKETGVLVTDLRGPSNHVERQLQEQTQSDSIRAQRRTALLSSLPSSADLHAIMDATVDWWATWKRLYPEVLGEKESWEIRDWVFWALKEENPVLVAKAMLVVAISARQLRAGIDDKSINLPMSAKDMMNQWLALVERLVISENDYVCCGEGIELIVLQAKIIDNLSQPKNGWLMFRRAVSIVQALNLRPGRRILSRESDMTPYRRDKLWWLMFEVDRYSSMLLGLPYSLPDEPEVLNSSVNPVSDTVVYRRKLAIIAGHVINRNHAGLTPSLSTTIQIDQELDEKAAEMPAEWWDVAAARSSDLISMEESLERLLTQTWHFQTKAFLHLPFMLQSASNRRLEYNRLACLDAARGLMKIYHSLRIHGSGAFFMGKIFDFQGFTSSLILILGLLGYGRMSPIQDNAQDEEDWRSVEATLDMLRRAASEEHDNIVATQAIPILELMSGMRCPMPGMNPENGKVMAKLNIPFFGLITITPGTAFSKRDLPAAEQMQTPVSESDGSTHDRMGTQQQKQHQSTPGKAAIGDSSAQQGSNFETDLNMGNGFPHIDIDWQNMEMDLDQDWNWFLDLAGTEIQSDSWQ